MLYSKNRLYSLNTGLFMSSPSQFCKGLPLKVCQFCYTVPHWIIAVASSMLFYNNFTKKTIPTRFLNTFLPTLLCSLACLQPQTRRLICHLPSHPETVHEIGIILEKSTPGSDLIKVPDVSETYLNISCPEEVDCFLKRSSTANRNGGEKKTFVWLKHEARDWSISTKTDPEASLCILSWPVLTLSYRHVFLKEKKHLKEIA